jgi:hypothetical protein
MLITPDTPDPQAENLQQLVENKVNEALDRKVADFRGKLRWFLLGLGLLIILLIANGLMSERAIITLLHDQVFGIENDFEGSLGKALEERISVSYNNHFWLGTASDLDRAQYISFYAGESQLVEANVEILHHGSGRPLEVAMRLGDQEILSGSQDYTLNRIDLSDYLDAHSHHGLPGNVHKLRFELVREDVGEPTDDRVFVGCLINVIGMERKAE